jgi:maltooligosyltrehalose trehalohydrolase
MSVQQMSRIDRSMPVGAEPQDAGATRFRLWAPVPRDISVVVERSGGPPLTVPMESEPEGYRAALVEGAAAGDRYWFRVGDRLLPDPASRFQPEGPFGPSEIVKPDGYRWTQTSWRGVTLPGQVLSEIHIGTFTKEGTWRAAVDCLPALADIGITVVEVMPISEFPGRFGWGYDGVFPYAPTRLYGTPDDFRAFVDEAHRIGLGVILDVVYNHFGPAGCVHREFSPSYFGRSTEWGEGINFDGPDSGPVREYFIENARYWIREFRLDGLRLDAVQSIHDGSHEHIVAAVTREARKAADGRDILVIAENERQDARLVRPVHEGGFGLDAVWNDDFHHSAAVAMTGRAEAYLSDSRGAPQEFISAAKYGYLFQGQRYAWQKHGRGTRTDGIAPSAFVTYLENHDQVANSGDGSRTHVQTSAGRYRAMTALLLLLPQTPMLFQGQEFGASSPFLYFADHEGELAEAVRKGRAEFVSQFPSLASPAAQARLPIPHDPATFERCKLLWEERRAHEAHVRLHRDLLALRRGDRAFRLQAAGMLDGAVLSGGAFVFRFMAPLALDERLLIVNLGSTLETGAFPEPLVAPPTGYVWEARWSSESPRYGGTGGPDIVSSEGWSIPGDSAAVLAPTEASDR